MTRLEAVVYDASRGSSPVFSECMSIFVLQIVFLLAKDPFKSVTTTHSSE